MKMLKKLALASAVSMLSVSAFAMEAMDDESMSSATGQDGITISLILPDFTPTAATNYAGGVVLQTLQQQNVTNSAGGITSGYKGIAIGEVRIHDDDGLTTSALTNNSGALVIGGGGTVNGAPVTQANDKTEVYTNQPNAVVIKLDMVGDSDGVVGNGNTAMLNVNITTPTLQIRTGNIYVANSNASSSLVNEDGAAPTVAKPLNVDGSTVTDKSAAIMSSSTMTLGVTTINVQLGSGEAQGHQIVINTSMTGGMSLNNFKINDVASAKTGNYTNLDSGGSITIGTMKVTDSGAANLTVVANIDVGSRISAAGQADLSTALQANGLSVAAANGTAAALQDVPNGLILELATLGNGSGIDVAMNNIVLGDSNITADIGDVQMIGIQLSGTQAVIVGH